MNDMGTTTPALLSAAELERMSFPDKQFELVRGKLIVREPPGTWQGMVQNNLALLVTQFVRANELGAVFGQDTGFRIRSDPDTVRAPDLAFVQRELVQNIPRRGYAALAPDLAAEIVSPDDRPGELLAKVADWLDAGDRLVWVIDPQRVEAHVYRADGTLSVLFGDGTLDGEDVLPDFGCRLAEVLALQ